MHTRSLALSRRKFAASLLAAMGGVGSAGTVLVPARSIAATDPAGERTADPQRLFQVERRLLNVAIPIELLTQLAIWDERSRDFRKAQRSEALGGAVPLLILHLWADWCAPCRAEFPLLRELEAQLARDRSGAIRLCCVAQIPHGEGMYAVVKEQRERMPRGPHYQDTGERIDRLLRTRFASESLPLPLTIILDRDAVAPESRRIIRYAVAGSLRPRTRELFQALDTLSALLTQG